MSRLASFHGPSTPNKNPVEGQRTGPPNATQTTSTPKRGKGKGASKIKTTSDADAGGGRSQFSPPSTPHKVTSPRAEGHKELATDVEFLESPFHKSFRQIIQEIRSVAKSWDDLIKGQSFKAAKELVDARTTIGNEITLNSHDGSWPHKVIVGPQMAIIDEKISILDDLSVKLQSYFDRLTQILSSLEQLHLQRVNEIYSLALNIRIIPKLTTGLDPESPHSPQSTWSSSQLVQLFDTCILPFYLRSLHCHSQIIRLLKKNDLEWETARGLLTTLREGSNGWTSMAWKGGVGAQDGLVQLYGITIRGGWSEELEDICSVEIPDWK
ncbi:hypothetical protein CPB86DRAFT_261923 [Serendipita vermifera]|nr:hypothetical protein CPB86DRAFT_261923 [Serendipita vermifera]